MMRAGAATGVRVFLIVCLWFTAVGFGAAVRFFVDSADAIVSDSDFLVLGIPHNIKAEIIIARKCFSCTGLLLHEFF